MIGTQVLADADPKGVFKSGIIADTSKPGTCMQVKAATAKVSGRFSYIFSAPTADTDPRPTIVLLEDELQGSDNTVAYTSGRVGRLYFPLPGEELNMLVKDISGTGDDHAIGDRFTVDHTTGKLIVQATSANRAQFTCLEVSTDPTADQWLLCMCN